MTNEEKKSNEIAAEYLMGHDRLEVTYEEMREAVMTMAEWKDQQWEKKIRKWLTVNTNWTSEFDEEGRNPDFGKIDEMFNDIKNGLI